jgi:hypothetical protein
MPTDYPDYPVDPINITARLVISKGYNWEPTPDLTKWHSDTPLPTIPVPREIRNLTGRTNGKMTIIGFLGKVKKSCRNEHKWLAKCTCGRYEIRDGYKFRRHKGVDECRYCNRVKSMKHMHNDVNQGGTSECNP